MSEPPGEPWQFCVSSVKRAEREEEKMSSEGWAVVGMGIVMREVSMARNKERRGFNNGEIPARLVHRSDTVTVAMTVNPSRTKCFFLL